MVQQRLRAINRHLSDLAETFSDKKFKIKNHDLILQSVEFLRNEIPGGRNSNNWRNKFKIGDQKNIQGIKIVAPYESRKG